jgi:molybdate-binding protein/DNA-binding XRE family transcriptional regulator
VRNHVRRVRRERGLGQAELARLSGVSRQTLGSIEAGRTDPATGIALALARALRCPVEELFGLEPAALEADIAPPLCAPLAPGPRRRAPSRVVLGEVAGRWVAHPLPPDHPASLSTGADALLPPRESSRRHARVHPLRSAEDLRCNLIAVGCDPALGLLAAHLAEARGGERLVWVPGPSTAALLSLAEGRAHLAGAHLEDEETGEFNLPFVRRLLPDTPVLLVNLARWREGLVVARGNPRGIHGAHDLARRGVRIVNREPGSGARRVLDKLLSQARVPPRRVRGYQHVVGGHAAVAQAVAMGAADAGVATESAALAHGLRFLPLAEERSDLVLPLSLAREPRGARLLEVLQGRAFRRDLAGIDAYETGQSGRVLAEVHA